MLLECVCFKINAFPIVLQSFWLSLGKLLAIALIACCWGASASKPMIFQPFYKHFGSHLECCLRLRSSNVAGVHLLRNQCFSVGPTSILALTCDAVCACVHRMLLGCVCFKINVFPFILKTFWLSLQLRSSHVAGVRLRQNQCFSIYFTSIFGSHCNCVHRMLLGCVCFIINDFPFALQAFWLSLRLRSSQVAEMRVLPATAFIACCWDAISSKLIFF